MLKQITFLTHLTSNQGWKISVYLPNFKKSFLNDKTWELSSLIHTCDNIQTLLKKHMKVLTIIDLSSNLIVYIWSSKRQMLQQRCCTLSLFRHDITRTTTLQNKSFKSYLRPFSKALKLSYLVSLVGLMIRTYVGEVVFVILFA